jgi:hypothetical protein
MLRHMYTWHKTLKEWKGRSTYQTANQVRPIHREDLDLTLLARCIWWILKQKYHPRQMQRARRQTWLPNHQYLYEMAMQESGHPVMQRQNGSGWLPSPVCNRVQGIG